MTKKHRLHFSASRVIRVASAVAALIVVPLSQATITWSGGTNTVGADQTPHDTSIVITGGTNTVHGASGPPSGTNGGILQLDSGGSGLEITGSTVTLNSDATSPGILSLMGSLTSHASSVTSLIATGGNAAVPGTLDGSSGTRTFTVEAGTVPANGPDLSITARIRNSGLLKEGAGTLALSGQNTFTGGTTLHAGKIYINSSSALGTGFFTVSGAGTSIDNTSGGPIILTTNNQFNLTGGDLNFIGSNNLNLGTGFFIMSGAASRTVNVQNAAATLTIGGIIADNGSGIALTKDGPGTLNLSAQSIYGGGTNVNGGLLNLAAGAEIGLGTETVNIASGATLNVDGEVNGNVSNSGLLTGNGIIDGSLVVNNGGIANISGGTLTVNGAVTNNGTFILRDGAQLGGATGFVNNATLDLISAGAVPSNLTNNGTILTPADVNTKSVAKAATTVTVTIDSYTGHSYQLQKSTTTPAGTTFTTNVGSPQQGSTGNVLTFTDPSASGSPSFYRIAVDS